MYNCYKLLGFDLLLDEDLKVHVIEANARPALLDDQLDKAVNRPMVSELLRIVGYHIPPSVGHHRDLIRKKFKLRENQKFLTFERKMYCRVLSDEEERKQASYPANDFKRDQYLEPILEGELALDT